MDIKEYNGTSLAYMGDAVMSLLVREMLLAQLAEIQNFTEEE